MIANWLKAYKTEIWIFLLAFGIRFLYAVFVQIKFGSHGFLAYSDAFSFYFRGAENLVKYHIFSLNSAPPYMPDAYRTPLYTFFVAFFLWLKLPLFSIIFVQNLMAGFISVFIYRIGRLLSFSYGTNLFAAIFMSLEPMSIYWNNLVMSDYLFAFLFLLAFYKFIFRKYYSFSFIFGLAALTRSIVVYIFPLFLIIMIFKNFSLRKIILTILIFLAVLFPWALRNKIVFNTWQLSSASWYNLNVVMEQFARENGFILPAPKLPLDYPNPQTFAYDPVNSPFYKQHFFEIFREHPLAYVKFHSELAFKSLIRNHYEYLANYVIKPKLPKLFSGISASVIALGVKIGGLAWILIYILALFSFFEIKSRPWFLLIFAIILFNAFSLGALVSVGFGSDVSRYDFPTAPLLFLFAGAGFNYILLFCRGSKFSRLR